MESVTKRYNDQLKDTDKTDNIMEISEICRGNKILISLPNSEIRIPNLEVEVQGISIFGEIECLNTPQKDGYTIDVRHCSGIAINKENLTGIGLIHYDDHLYENGSYTLRMGLKLSTEYTKWGIYFNNSWIKDVEYIHEIQNLITFLK